MEQGSLNRADRLGSEYRLPENLINRCAATPALGSCAIKVVGAIGNGWQLVEPLSVLVERDSDGWWVLSDEVFMVYGTGQTPREAYADYVQSLIEYRGLVAEGAANSAHDRLELERLDHYLHPLQA